MSDVFISYSRRDQEFVGKLREALLEQEQDIWIDWEDIPPSQAWWDEIRKGIAKANNVVVILSPNSMASPICHMEIEYARQLQKRIIPVLYKDYDREESVNSIAQRLNKQSEATTRELWETRQAYDIYDANDGELKHINYLFFRDEDDFNTRFNELFEIIRTDYAHKEQHTTLELRAQEWDRRERNVSFLLIDDELVDAQTWLENAVGKEPEPTALQHEFIQASEQRTRQLRNIRRASIIGTTVAVLALIFAVGASLIGVREVTTANVAVAEAQTQEAEANRQAAQAETQAADAATQQGIAEEQAAEAGTQQSVAETQAAGAEEQAAQASTQQAAAEAQAANAEEQASLAETQAADAATQQAIAEDQAAEAGTQQSVAETQAAGAEEQAAQASTQSI